MDERRLEVARVVSSRVRMDVRESDGLFWLGSDRVLDVEFSEELAIPCDRVSRLFHLFADGFKPRIAMVRKDGIYIKTIDFSMDGWLDTKYGIQRCIFHPDGYGEISPIKRLCDAKSEWFE